MSVSSSRWDDGGSVTAGTGNEVEPASGKLDHAQWVRQLLATLGVHVQEDEPGLLRLLATPEQARLLGHPRQATGVWALDPAWLLRVPQAQLLVPGSERFETLRRIARERARVSRLFLAADPPTRPSPSFTLCLAPIGVLFFDVYTTGRVPWQLRANVAVDLLTGVARSDAWSRWQGLHWREEPAAVASLPRQRRRLSYRQMLDQAAGALRQWLAQAVDWSWTWAEQRAQQEEEDQVHAYYDALARQERGLHREDERAHHLEEIRRRYSLLLEAEPVSLLILFRPVGLVATPSPGQSPATPWSRSRPPLPGGAILWDPLP